MLKDYDGVTENKMHDSAVETMLSCSFLINFHAIFAISVFFISQRRVLSHAMHIFNPSGPSITYFPKILVPLLSPLASQGSLPTPQWRKSKLMVLWRSRTCTAYRDLHDIPPSILVIEITSPASHQEPAHRRSLYILHSIYTRTADQLFPCSNSFLGTSHLWWLEAGIPSCMQPENFPVIKMVAKSVFCYPCWILYLPHRHTNYHGVTYKDRPLFSISVPLLNAFRENELHSC